MQDECEIYHTIFSNITGYNDSKEVATLQRQDIKMHKSYYRFIRRCKRIERISFHVLKLKSSKASITYFSNSRLFRTPPKWNLLLKVQPVGFLPSFDIKQSCIINSKSFQMDKGKIGLRQFSYFGQNPIDTNLRIIIHHI